MSARPKPVRPAQPERSSFPSPELEGPALENRRREVLVQIDVSGAVLDAVGEEMLHGIGADGVDILETSTAVFEKSGEYAFRRVAPGWCEFMNTASRRLCGMNSDREAMESGTWHCHESCWNEASRPSMERGEVVDVPCRGGLRLLAVPIFASGEAVGSINLGYGAPSRDPHTLAELAARYQVTVEQLERQARAHAEKPPRMVEIAKNRLLLSARLIGEMIERKRAETMLEQKAGLAANRLTSVLESASDAVLVLDPDWHITLQNEQASQLLFSGSDATGRALDQYLERSAAPQFYRKCREAIDQQIPMRSVDYYAPAGKWLEGRIWPSKEEVAVYLRDVTAEKRAEDAARRLAAIVEGSEDSIYSHDLAGVITSWNRGAEHVFGFRAEEIVGQSITLLAPQEAPGDVAELLQAVARGESIDHYETVRQTKDGRRIDVALTISPIRNGTGQTLGACRIARDITARKRAERALAESEARFRMMADSIPQIVWTARPDGWLDYYNQRWFEYTGLNLEQTEGWGWRPVLHPDDVQNCINRWTKAYTTGTPYEIEYRFRRARDGMYRWHLGRALPVHDEHGRITKWIGSCTDIHDQKAMLDALEQSNQDLEQFGYAVSHDLQEPLRMVSVFSQLLARRYQQQLGAEADQFLQEITTGAERLEMLLSDLRLYLQAGRFDQRTVAPMDANSCLHQVLSNLETLIHEEGARITSDELPPVKVLAVHLQQLLQNLISNALKYRRAEPPRVHIGAERRGALWCFAVSDNGIGIDPRYREQVFGLFKRLHGQEYPGTGLGLAICQKIVERYGGEIWIEPGNGVGSIFCFTLPAH